MRIIYSGFVVLVLLISLSQVASAATKHSEKEPVSKIGNDDWVGAKWDLFVHHLQAKVHGEDISKAANTRKHERAHRSTQQWWASICQGTNHLHDIQLRYSQLHQCNRSSGCSRHSKDQRRVPVSGVLYQELRWNSRVCVSLGRHLYWAREGRVCY